MDVRLQGRFAIVTGGGNGIGAAVCERFAMEGATVVVVDWDETAAKERAASLPGAVAVQGDVSDRERVDVIVGDTIERFGRLDVLANVAGVDDPQAKLDITAQLEAGEPLDITSKLTDAQWRRMMSINLDGTFYFLRAALRVMLAQGSGSIINVASLAGVSGVAGSPHYSASKAGIIGLTQSVAKEVADRGVRVNAIAPGGVDTAMVARAPLKAGYGPTIPIQRLARPSEIAALALYLANDESSYMTGETLNINGGALTV